MFACSRLHAQQERIIILCSKAHVKLVHLDTFVLVLFPITMMWLTIVLWVITAKMEHNQPFSFLVQQDPSTIKHGEKIFMIANPLHQDIMHREQEILFLLENVRLGIIVHNLQQQVHLNVRILFVPLEVNVLLGNNAQAVQAYHYLVHLVTTVVTTAVW